MGTHLPLIVDNFAGGGGASTGIEAALGRAVDIAINHDEEAIRMHEVNHPGTHHIRNNIWQVDPRDVVHGRHVQLAWFSPDCKHFSKAKGGKPREKSIRDLAWVVVLWAERVAPDVILLENVEEFRTWGPLDDEGKPIKERAGETFEKWCRSLRRAGYKLQFRELRACDYGAPTIRKRFFMIARRDGLPIAWPEPTHGKPGSPEVLSGKRQPWRTAADIIDWSIPCPSIFDRKKPLAEKTLRRIAHGIMKFVVNNPAPFIVPLTHRQPGARGAGVDQPMATVTGANRGEHAVVVPHITKFRTGQVGHDVGEPLHTVTANSFVKRPGGAAPLGVVEAALAPFASYAQQGGGSRSMEDPLHTVTASDGDHNTICAAHLVRVAHGDDGRDRTHSANEPLGTQPASNEFAAVAAHLVHVGNGEREGQAPRAMDVEKPLGTVVAGGIKHHAVAALLQKFATGNAPTEPSEPIQTIEGNAKHSVVVAHLEQANGGPNNDRLAGRAADQPLSTATASGSQQRIVTSNLVKLRGGEDSHFESCGVGADEPLHTICASGTHMAEVRAFLLKYYGTDQDPQLGEPLHTVTTKDRYGVVTVTIGGEEYAIVDIGMRMLTPRELFSAQGFPFWKRSFKVETWHGPTIRAVDDQEPAPESTTRATSAGSNSSGSQPDGQSERAAVHALIDLGLQVLQLRSPGRSSSDVQSVEPIVSVPLPTGIASAAQTLAPDFFASAIEPIRFARPSASAFTPAPSGGRPVSLFGGETTQPAVVAESVTVTEIGVSKSTTSQDGPRSQNCVSTLQTLSCFVVDAIASSTLSRTSTGSLSVELEVRHEYIIDRDADGRPITKTAQVAKCGNSVCPPIAAALVRAQFPAEAATVEPEQVAA